MLITFIVLSVTITVLYLLSMKKYKEFLAPVDEGRYPLKGILPVGLYILDLCKYKYRTKYDHRLLTKIAQISGAKNANNGLKVHWANKIVYILLWMLFSTLVGMGAGTDISVGIFLVILLAAILYFNDHELDRKIQKRKIMLEMDFPDFLNKLTLLINAGMTISKAWEKIVLDSRKDSLLYEELKATLAEIKGGKPETRAYEDFGKRCRIPEITRFASSIIQNIRKGNGEIVAIFRLQANDCWEKRKDTARKLGEEASTKMLLPMMIMFAAILIIVAVPAVLALRGI